MGKKKRNPKIMWLWIRWDDLKRQMVHGRTSSTDVGAERLALETLQLTGHCSSRLPLVVLADNKSSTGQWSQETAATRQHAAKVTVSKKVSGLIGGTATNHLRSNAIHASIWLGVWIFLQITYIHGQRISVLSNFGRAPTPILISENSFISINFSWIIHLSKKKLDMMNFQSFSSCQFISNNGPMEALRPEVKQSMVCRMSTCEQLKKKVTRACWYSTRWLIAVPSRIKHDWGHKVCKPAFTLKLHAVQ